jgi:hypothetical protein
MNECKKRKEKAKEQKKSEHNVIAIKKAGAFRAEQLHVGTLVDRERL